ncbi:MAG: BamA/TamA family outer membrane protein [Draconibacterium sp.]
MHKYFLIAFILLSALGLMAQEQATDTVRTETEPEKRIDFSVVPFVNYNRNLEFMFGAVPMMMYRIDPEDKISPKSLTGVNVFYSTNSSYMVGLFNTFHFKEGKWRGNLFLLRGNINSQFYMEGLDPGFVDYGTKSTFLSVGIKRRISPGLYAGVGYTHANHVTDYDDENLEQSTTRTNGIQLNLQRDSRNAVYYPTTGQLIDVKWNTFPKWIDNEEKANKITAAYNQYFPARGNKDVVATRLSGKFGLGNIAFEQQVTVGNKDIRGYSEGKYRGDGLMAFQGEYRYNFGEKVGMVGFAGVATIYGSDTESFNWNLLPGAGVGIRYRAFKTVKFNVGLDAAVGKDDWSIAFRIGEAF